jgi:hypothetical protein
VSRSFYVYAIVSRDTPLPALGSSGAVIGLAMVPWQGLAAVTRRIEGDDARFTIEAVLHHEAVVEAVRKQGPALPVRFGTVFRDATSVATALAERYEPLAADLARLGDKVELSVTALWAAAPFGDGSGASRQEDGVPSGRSAGARYLHARAAELRRDDALKELAQTAADQLNNVLGAFALDRRVSLLPTPRVAVRTAYLLDPAGVSDFRAAFETIRATRADLRVLLTGPWPPYNFVRRTEAQGEGRSDSRLGALVQLLTDAQGRHG